MGIERVSVKIEGVTPLLLNKFTDAKAQDATNGTRVSQVGDRGTPREQSEARLYLGKDGETLIVPQPNIFRAIIDAGTYFKAGKSKVSTRESSLIPACVWIEEVELPIAHKEPWTVDTRPVRIPSTGGRILCHRPSFNDWALSFTCSIDTELLSVKMLREIVDAAGKRIGLGDFRPARKGPFGRFVVTKWEVEQLETKAA